MSLTTQKVNILQMSTRVREVKWLAKITKPVGIKSRIQTQTQVPLQPEFLHYPPIGVNNIVVNKSWHSHKK